MPSFFMPLWDEQARKANRNGQKTNSTKLAGRD
jgi:hypothetical protein